ncbi:hypothetical protein Tco_0884450, partial [Tanacetum coccineum]
VQDCPDCDDSRARGFVLRSLEFHILSFILGIHEKSGTMNLSVRTFRRLFYGRFSFYDPNVDKIKEVEHETDIQEKEQKENQRQTNPSTEWKGQKHKVIKMKKIQLEGLKLPKPQVVLQKRKTRAITANRAEITFKL